MSKNHQTEIVQILTWYSSSKYVSSEQPVAVATAYRQKGLPSPCSPIPQVLVL